jgi:hypothetical protein
MTNPALEVLYSRSSDCSKDAQRRRAEKRTPVDMASYREGETIGYSDAAKIMKAELKRLQLAFQNGHLTVSDFGVW